ncbi:Cytochrome P450 18a1 like protein [Argiope bruennichi]|uniref:Cytochrome P450 18a1 like protein n=1 Tax=Argiope bruennichi TaxID=94029 RepID=A0A8T0E1I1_ARGBR|nr:Cytochrome P450 18a1 like protein [Argiope bruennichi]
MEGDLISDIMESLSPQTLIISLAVLILAIAYFSLKDKDLPPGPIGLPYFGYWPFLSNSNCHLKLHALRKKHGDVFSFKGTGRLYINLGSLKAIREALVTKSEYFGDRVMDYNLMTHLYRDGIAFVNGEPWKVVRKYFAVLLKERGSNSLKTSIAGPFYDSIKRIISELKEKNGEPINLIDFLTHKCNIIMRLTLFGEIGATEEQIRKLNELYAIQLRCFLPKSLLLCGTFAKYFIFPFMPHFSEALKCRIKMEKLLYELIDEHKSTYDPDNPRDIIDEFFKERDRRQSKGDPTAEYFTDKILMGSLMQFMADGVLSIASIIGILIKNLIDHPEEQDKIYKEIVEVVGQDRQPAIEDKSKLTFFNACVLETFRTSDFFTFFMSQECTKETTLGGYRIPKRAILLINFYSCNHDPEIYEEQEKFNPSRFIPTEGKKRPELPILFGIGKRSCLGEGFVMTQIFLLLTTLIQNFHLSLSGDPEKLPIEIFLSGNLPVCAKPRE